MERDFGEKDPLDQLFEDMDDSFLRDEALIREIDALEQNMPLDGPPGNIFPDPFDETVSRIQSGGGIIRNSKSMMDFSALPSVKRDVFSFISDDHSMNMNIKQENTPDPPSFPNIRRKPTSSTSSSSKKNTGKKVGFQVDAPKSKKNVPKETPEEKRQRRLARNRESARQSRRRKKQQLENIEQQVVKLTIQLNTERQEFFETYFKKRRDKRIEFLTRLQQVHDQNELLSQIKYFDSVFGTSDGHSLQLRQFHFYHAFDVLFPQYFRFFLQVVGSCSDDISVRKKNENNGVNSSWETFSRDIGLSNAQKEKLRSDLKSLYAPEADSEQSKLFALVSLLQGLKKSFDLRTTVIQAQVKALFGALSPDQVAKFLLFFENDFEVGESQSDDKLSTENLKYFVKNNDITLDEQTKQALEFLEVPDENLSLEDLQKMVQIAGR